MGRFDITHFEHRVDRLIDAYHSLLSDYQALEKAHADSQQRNSETRERLHRVIERIRALEAEADNA